MKTSLYITIALLTALCIYKIKDTYQSLWTIKWKDAQYPANPNARRTPKEHSEKDIMNVLLEAQDQHEIQIISMHTLSQGNAKHEIRMTLQGSIDGIIQLFRTLETKTSECLLTYLKIYDMPANTSNDSMVDIHLRY
jgi:hypothetical protein